MIGNRVRRTSGRFLENGPHKVAVFLAHAEDSRAGRRYVYEKDQIIVDHVLVQPSAGNALKAAETRTAMKSLIDETTLRVIGTGIEWPGGPHSLVKVLEGPSPYRGNTYQQSGTASAYNASPMTTHFAVRLDELNTEVK